MCCATLAQVGPGTVLIAHRTIRNRTIMTRCPYIIPAYRIYIRYFDVMLFQQNSRRPYFSEKDYSVYPKKRILTNSQTILVLDLSKKFSFPRKPLEIYLMHCKCVYFYQADILKRFPAKRFLSKLKCHP